MTQLNNHAYNAMLEKFQIPWDYDYYRQVGIHKKDTRDSKQPTDIALSTSLNSTQTEHKPISHQKNFEAKQPVADNHMGKEI